MSRSYRKAPVAAWTRNLSEKQDKRMAHRRLRKAVKTTLVRATETPTMPALRDVSDVWGFAKDGKRLWWQNEHAERVARWYRPKRK